MATFGQMVMHKLTVFLLVSFWLTGCSQVADKTIGANDRQGLIPEPDKGERLKYEALEKLRKAGCFLINPDTSISSLKLRDAESAAALIGSKNKVDSNEQYHFYSKLDKEVLTLTQHPGDRANQISIFNIKYSDKADYAYQQLPIDYFKSEKGIKLGMARKQIVEILGNCYARLDSAKGYVNLYYRIESPKDSKTKLLQRHNMPVYYASYKLWNDKLEEFEFGFEYP